MSNTENANTPDFETRAMVAASDQVLCKSLPLDFNDRDEDEMDKFVGENAWEPFENWEAKQLWTQISDVASALTSFHKAEKAEEMSDVIDLTKDIIVGCPKHGDFNVNAQADVDGVGCPSCEEEESVASVNQ